MTTAFLIYILKSSGIITLFLFTYILFLEKETFFKANRIFLIFGIFISFFLPTFQIIKTIEVVEPVISTKIPVLADQITENPPGKPFSTDTLLFWLYGFGVLILSTKIIVHLIILQGLYKGEHTVIENGIRYIYSDKIAEPFSFLNTVYINKNDYTTEEFHLIKLHEETHVIQKHSYDTLLLQFTCILLWFNPFIWIYKIKARQNLEYLADQSVIAKQINIKKYQYLLLKNSIHQNQPLLTNTFFNSLIKKRIVMLIKNKSPKTTKLKFLIILPLLLIFTLIFNSRTEAQIVSYESPSKETIQNDSISFVITKNHTGDQLQAMAKLFIMNNIQFNFRDVKRNKMGTITAIAIECINSSGEKFNYQSKDKGSSGISNILIVCSKNEPNEPMILTKIQKYAEKTAIIPYAVIETPPIFPGCEGQPVSDLRSCFKEKINSYIKTNLRIPSLSPDEQTGTAYVLFKINTDGTVSDIRVRAPNKMYEEEAIRVIRSLPKITPGLREGKSVEIPFSIPIDFEAR